jgi:hypothetical protein
MTLCIMRKSKNSMAVYKGGMLKVKDIISISLGYLHKCDWNSQLHKRLGGSLGSAFDAWFLCLFRQSRQCTAGLKSFRDSQPTVAIKLTNLRSLPHYLSHFISQEIRLFESGPEGLSVIDRPVAVPLCCKLIRSFARHSWKHRALP